MKSWLLRGSTPSRTGCQECGCSPSFPEGLEGTSCLKASRGVCRLSEVERGGNVVPSASLGLGDVFFLPDTFSAAKINFPRFGSVRPMRECVLV